MAGLAKFLSNLVLDHIVGRSASINLGGDAYIALSTSEPTADGTNVAEPTGNGYARVLLGLNGQAATYKIGVAADGANTNTAEIHFAKATGAWGTCTHFLIFDALTGGNLLMFGALGSSISPTSGDVAIVEVGALDLSLT